MTRGEKRSDRWFCWVIGSSSLPSRILPLCFPDGPSKPTLSLVLLLGIDRLRVCLLLALEVQGLPVSEESRPVS